MKNIREDQLDALARVLGSREEATAYLKQWGQEAEDLVIPADIRRRAKEQGLSEAKLEWLWATVGEGGVRKAIGELTAQMKAQTEYRIVEKSAGDALAKLDAALGQLRAQLGYATVRKDNAEALEAQRLSVLLAMAEGLLLKPEPVIALIKKYGLNEVESVLQILAGKTKALSLEAAPAFDPFYGDLNIRPDVLQNVEGVLAKRKALKSFDKFFDPFFGDMNVPRKR